MQNVERKQIYARQRRLGGGVIEFKETMKADELRALATKNNVKLPDGKKVTKTIVLEALRAHNANAAVVDDMRLSAKQRRRLRKKAVKG